MEPEYPILSEAFFADPYPLLRQLREECPVYYHAPLGAWFLARHDHCEMAVRDRRLSNARARELLSTLMPTLRGTGELEAMIGQWSRLLWFLDPPKHTRSRGLVMRGFSAAAIERVRGEVRASVEQALANVAGGGEIDVVWQLADPVALDVLCAIFGLPHDQRAEFRRWTTDIMQAAGAGAMDEDPAMRAKESSFKLFGLLSAIVHERCARPGDDMISRFLGDERGDPAVIEEVTIQCFQMVGAGYVTSRNQIACAVLALLEHPDELARLRTDPRLLVPAIEELLRFAPSVLTTNRLAAEDLEIGGKQIRQGQLVFPILASANRDPAAYVEPDRLDLARGGRPMTFSVGPHYCPGGPLARLELEEALAGLLRFSSWQQLGDFDYRGASLQDRGPSQLRVQLGV
ncbi:cytochrome P450 [Nannocystis bainbridge]|uniref:Cytochrome P450 n=1 Tax=Nannocystis bainbridge TaxID=2995303 RepID=A0ABT5E5V0_9BACT|nr:cytochrome P450 [Nannocystis bainbridge]MDC0720318.1 cytochrome P450 [Nannocystis bainbridge]